MAKTAARPAAGREASPSGAPGARLSVFRALGDRTRFAIYSEVASSSMPLSTSDIADLLDLHPNTVRPHLERLRDAGLLEVESASQGSVGRPQHRYMLAADAPSLGLEPPAYPLLADLLAQLAAELGPRDDDVAEVGRSWGRHEAETLDTGGSEDSPCVAALVAELAELGFDPTTECGESRTTVAFTRCPYRELAEAHPELVCCLHRGIVEGIVERVGGAAVANFATLADRDPCRVELVVR
ncbi:MAG TPA: helix-turn-helix domain-containing protein [Acidimicrobiales bacterium]